MTASEGREVSTKGRVMAEAGAGSSSNVVPLTSGLARFPGAHGWGLGHAPRLLALPYHRLQ